MNANPPFFELAQPCDEASGWLMGLLRQAGLRVQRTFDLQVARRAQTSYPCPYHGAAACDCQMLVLLVYGGSLGPVTIVAHGRDRHTCFSLVDTAEQRADRQVEATIYSVMNTAFPAPN